MPIQVEVTITNTEDNRTLHYRAQFDDLEILESHMTGALSFKPGLDKVHPWGAKLAMPQSRSPWELSLEGDWETGP